MNRRSTKGIPGEWRVYWLSGQVPCRTPIGAAFGAVLAKLPSFLDVTRQSSSSLSVAPRHLFNNRPNADHRLM
jgi:hypothetical protein